MKELISVIVPVYNTEKYLEDCIRSIISQIYTNWELILINDGSTDSSIEICKSFAANDQRIKIFCQKNQGPSAARNKGLDFCKGQYICFIDSDDMIHHNFLIELWKNLVEVEADISMCKTTHSEYTHVEKVYGLDLKNFFKVVESMNDKIIVCSKLYKKEIWEELRFTAKYYEDVIIFPKIFEEKKIAFTPSKLYFYRTREGSRTTVFSEDSYKLRIGAFDKLISYFSTRCSEGYYDFLNEKIYYSLQNYYRYNNLDSRDFLYENLWYILRLKTLRFKEKVYLIFSFFKLNRKVRI